MNGFKAALISIEIALPVNYKYILVNLLPADIVEKGTHYDFLFL